MGENVFRILEIEPTTDKKEIKKAYAKLVKRYHPEEYPEEWKRIHDAYELALKLAQYGQQDGGMAVPPSGQQPPQPIQRVPEAEKPEPRVQPPQPIQRTPEAEMPPSPSKPENSDVDGDTDTDGMNLLFQEIGQLSRKQQRQAEEVHKKAVASAIETLKRMAQKKKLNQQEWEAFFRREDMLPLFCSDEFLRELGECLVNREIDREMYRFLSEQLFTIEQYRNSQNTVNENTIWDPIEAARVKIHSAYARKRTVYDTLKDMKTAAKAFLWVAVVLTGIAGTYLRHTAPERERQEQQKEYESRSEEMRDFLTIAAETEQTRQEDLQRISEFQKKVGEELREQIEIVEIGDTREKMISLYGEPDIIQPYPDNPEYEEAVYHQSVTDLKIVLDEDVVVYLYYELAESE